MNGISSLKEAIRTVPIPGAPMSLSKEGAAVGLAFLDMALRQNHVRRLTERLQVIEHRAARRTTEVDIRLSLLDRSQREASHLFQKLTSRSTGIEAEEGVARPSIWVPVTRISRRSVSPIDVVDSAGCKLPRLTQYETSRLLASGLYRLLRGVLSSHPDSRQDSDLGQFLFRLDESRWLVQAALVALLTERSGPAEETKHSPTPNTVGGHGKQYRDIAISVLEKYEETLLNNYVQLLDVAINDYLLVVALDAAKDDHLLSYDSPVHIGTQRPQQNVIYQLTRGDWTRYRIGYIARVPSSLRSYHVVAETEPGVDIETMSLVTNADEVVVRELISDLRTLAHWVRAETRTRSIERKLLELELQSTLGPLSELLRKRRWEANHAEMSLAEDRLKASSRLAWAFVSGEGVLNDEGEVRSSLLRHPNVTADNLEAAADEVSTENLASDFSLENDPASSRAHAYWRRASSRSSAGGHTRIHCTLTLRDATGTRPGSVMRYVFAVAMIIYLTGCFLEGTPWPYGGLGHGRSTASTLNADAVVAVLLLVPGFLYTRLDLPARHTIAGRLSSLSRHVAHISIGAAVVLAAAVAAGVSGSAFRALLALSTMLPLLASILLVWRPARRKRTAPFLAAPNWLRPSDLRVPAVPVDAIFYSSGSDHD